MFAPLTWNQVFNTANQVDSFTSKCIPANVVVDAIEYSILEILSVFNEAYNKM